MFGLGEGAPVDVYGERLVGWGTPVVKGDESGVDVRSLPILDGVPSSDSYSLHSAKASSCLTCELFPVSATRFANSPCPALPLLKSSPSPTDCVTLTSSISALLSTTKTVHFSLFLSLFSHFLTALHPFRRSGHGQARSYRATSRRS
jgi:hypothetical protein